MSIPQPVTLPTDLPQPTHVNESRLKVIFSLVEKGPTVDATDAPQLGGLLCNPVMKISFLVFRVMEHRRNESHMGEQKYLGGKPVPVQLCPPQIPHGLTPESNPALRGDSPATNRLSQGTAKLMIYVTISESSARLLYGFVTK
jgi:hypothetical protein